MDSIIIFQVCRRFPDLCPLIFTEIQDMFLELSGEKEEGDGIWENAFLHSSTHFSVLEFGQTVVKPIHGIHLWQPGSHQRQAGGATCCQKQSIQLSSYSKRGVLTPAIFCAEEGRSLCAAVWLPKFSIHEQKRKKKGGIIKGNKSQTKTSNPNYVRYAISNLSLKKKKTKKDEFFFLLR